jgi:hypothetical protein
LSDQGYAPTFKSLMDDTPWDMYGVGRNARCDNCMAHCGFEGTAVNDAFSHPLKAMATALRGPRTAGPMAPDPPILYQDRRIETTIAVSAVTRAKRTPTADSVQ